MVLNTECFARVIGSKKDFQNRVKTILPDGAIIVEQMVKGNYRVFHHFVTSVTDTVTETSETALSELRDELCQICHDSLVLYRKEQDKSRKRIQVLLGREIPEENTTEE